MAVSTTGSVLNYLGQSVVLVFNLIHHSLLALWSRSFIYKQHLLIFLTMPTPNHDDSSEAIQFAFPLFSQLPTEMRLKIWSAFLHLTRPSPVTITISVGEKTQRWVADDSILRKGHQIPAIMQVCQESREVGQAQYVLGFDLEGGLSELPFNHCWRMVDDAEN